MTLCWAAFIVILGCMGPVGCGSDPPDVEEAKTNRPPKSLFQGQAGDNSGPNYSRACRLVFEFLLCPQDLPHQRGLRCLSS